MWILLVYESAIWKKYYIRCSKDAVTPNLLDIIGHL